MAAYLLHKTIKPVGAVMAAGLALLLFGLHPLGAQVPAEDDYILGPRDELAISVWGDPRMSLEVAVSEEGLIHYFFIGDVKAAGLSVRQLREKITKLLSQYYRDPVVTVRLINYRSKEVLVIGAVNGPGVYYLDTNTTNLIRLISIAKGTAPGRGARGIIYRGAADKIKDIPSLSETPDDSPEDEARSAAGTGYYERIERELAALQGIERIEVNLVALLDFGDPTQDQIIYPKDIVIISSDITDNPARNYVWVSGAVRNPQRISWQPGLTVLQAITQCGGMNDVASPNRTYITRSKPDGQTERIRVRIKRVQKGTAPDVPLEPGDQITVPESAF